MLIVRTDLKLHLAGTDYGSFLANEPSPLSVSVIDDKLREKLVIEFQHMRNHSVEPLSQFLDFITYSYMIDNIILLITGTLHQRPISELIPKCHPLGSFEQMEAIHVAATPAELYNAVLVDTPLGKVRGCRFILEIFLRDIRITSMHVRLITRRALILESSVKKQFFCSPLLRGLHLGTGSG